MAIGLALGLNSSSTGSAEAGKGTARPPVAEQNINNVDELNRTFTHRVNSGDIVPAAIGVVRVKDGDAYKDEIKNPLLFVDDQGSATKGGPTLYFGRITINPDTGEYSVAFAPLEEGKEIFVSDLPLSDPNEIKQVRVGRVGMGNEVPNMGMDQSGTPLSQGFDENFATKVGTNLSNGGPFQVGLVV